MSLENNLKCMTCLKDSYEINTEAMSIIMGGGISQSIFKKKKAVA